MHKDFAIYSAHHAESPRATVENSLQSKKTSITEQNLTGARLCGL